MKYLKSLSFRTKAIVSLILLALFAYSVYSYVWPKYIQWKEDHEVQIVKTKVERIETFGSQNRYVYYKTKNSIPADVLSNHFVTSDAKFVGRGSNQPVELSFDVYDLNHLKNPPKRLMWSNFYKPTIRDTNWTFRQEEDIRIMEGIIWFFLW